MTVPLVTLSVLDWLPVVPYLPVIADSPKDGDIWPRRGSQTTFLESHTFSGGVQGGVGSEWCLPGEKVQNSWCWGPCTSPLSSPNPRPCTLHGFELFLWFWKLLWKLIQKPAWHYFVLFFHLMSCPRVGQHGPYIIQREHQGYIRKVLYLCRAASSIHFTSLLWTPATNEMDSPPHWALRMPLWGCPLKPPKWVRAWY